MPLVDRRSEVRSLEVTQEKHKREEKRMAKSDDGWRKGTASIVGQKDGDRADEEGVDAKP